MVVAVLCCLLSFPSVKSPFDNCFLLLIDMADRFWIVAIPTDNGSMSRTLSHLTSATTGLCTVSEFAVPKLAIGTLDKLMQLSDTLTKTDEQAESVVKRIGKQYADTINEHNQANTGTSSTATMALTVDNGGAQCSMHLIHPLSCGMHHRLAFQEK